MKNATQGDANATVSYDIQHVFKGDGEEIPVPSSFFCDPNWKKMAPFYIDYIEKHKLKEPIGTNIFGSYDNLN